mmetsp:Transcript_41506/g.133983  ORF Transcript_41506/g.133983 Transcript_41506/m.133983 type:complete len:83 (-) Transcript_41506:8-256(-)
MSERRAASSRRHAARGVRVATRCEPAAASEVDAQRLAATTTSITTTMACDWYVRAFLFSDAVRHNVSSAQSDRPHFDGRCTS